MLRKPARTRTVPASILDRALALYLQGYSPERTSWMLGREVSASTIRRVLRSCGVPTNQSIRNKPKP